MTTTTEKAPEAPQNPVGTGGLLIRDVAVAVRYPLRAKAKSMGLKYDAPNKTWIAPAGVRYGALKAAGFQLKAA